MFIISFKVIIETYINSRTLENANNKSCFIGSQILNLRICIIDDHENQFFSQRNMIHDDDSVLRHEYSPTILRLVK